MKIQLSENTKSVLIVAASAAAFIGAVRGISFVRKKLAGRKSQKAETIEPTIESKGKKPLFESETQKEKLRSDDRVEIA